MNFFLIVSARRFTENDAWVDNEIQKQDTQFFFIRNKINLDLENEKRDHPKLNSKLMNKIRLFEEMNVSYYDSIGNELLACFPFYMINQKLSTLINALEYSDFNLIEHF